MKNKTLKAIVGIVATAGVMGGTTQQVQAGTIHNGWNYAMDSFRDGTDHGKVGQSSRFEYYGMAFQETADELIFAFNSNLAFDPANPAKTGVVSNKSLGRSITYGDLFLNFTHPDSFNAAQKSLYAVRFDQTNDTHKQFSVGLYKDVSTTSYATQNQGYGTVSSHTNTVNNKLHGFADYGDLRADTDYFKPDQAAPTAIAAGTRLGNIDFLSAAMLSNLGLNFGAKEINQTQEVGTQTFGFKINKSTFGGSLPKGDFVASLFAECGNDGMVLKGHRKGRVPEPSAMLGLVAVGLIVGAKQIKQSRTTGVEV